MLILVLGMQVQLFMLRNSLESFGTEIMKMLSKLQYCAEKLYWKKCKIFFGVLGQIVCSQYFKGLYLTFCLILSVLSVIPLPFSIFHFFIFKIVLVSTLTGICIQCCKLFLCRWNFLHFF